MTKPNNPNRRIIIGEIISIKEHAYKYTHNFYRHSLKILVVGIPDGDRYYGTMPSGIYPQIGDIVSFLATIKPIEPGFSYFSFPVRGEIKQYKPLEYTSPIFPLDK